MGAEFDRGFQEELEKLAGVRTEKAYEMAKKLVAAWKKRTGQDFSMRDFMRERPAIFAEEVGASPEQVKRIRSAIRGQS